MLINSHTTPNSSNEIPKELNLGTGVKFKGSETTRKLGNLIGNIDLLLLGFIGLVQMQRRSERSYSHSIQQVTFSGKISSC